MADIVGYLWEHDSVWIGVAKLDNEIYAAVTADEKHGNRESCQFSLRQRVWNKALTDAPVRHSLIKRYGDFTVGNVMRIGELETSAE